MKGHDHQCLVLAQHCLDDEPTARYQDVEQLANHIQRAVEDWIESWRPDPIPEVGG
jgi:hypothetical protein